MKDARAELMKEVLAQIKRLQRQLPHGMKSCTIVFRRCNIGHGRLVATNWIDRGCHWCEIKRLRRLVEGAYKEGCADGDTFGRQFWNESEAKQALKEEEK